MSSLFIIISSFYHTVVYIALCYTSWHMRSRSGHRRSGVGTPTWRDDGRAFGEREDKRMAMLAVSSRDGGRRQGGGARH